MFRITEQIVPDFFELSQASVVKVAGDKTPPRVRLFFREKHSVVSYSNIRVSLNERAVKNFGRGNLSCGQNGFYEHDAPYARSMRSKGRNFV